MFFLRFFCFGLALFCINSYALDSVYIGGSIKANNSLKFHHLGWTGDDICYPNMNNCSDKQKHKGFAWIYQLPSVLFHPGLGIHAGVKTHQNIRLELSLDGFQSIQDSKQKFLGIYYLKESKNPFPDTVSFWDGVRFPKLEELSGSLEKVSFQETELAVSSENSFSDLRVLTALINIYIDFPKRSQKITPYFGLGAGYSLVKAHIIYKGKYEDSSLDSIQSEGFSGLSLSARLKIGLNYDFSDRFSYGLEGAYTMLKGAEDTVPYKKHPNQKNNNIIIRDVRHLTASLYLNYKL